MQRCASKWNTLQQNPIGDDRGREYIPGVTLFTVDAVCGSFCLASIRACICSGFVKKLVTASHIAGSTELALTRFLRQPPSLTLWAQTYRRINLSVGFLTTVPSFNVLYRTLYPDSGLYLRPQSLHHRIPFSRWWALCFRPVDRVALVGFCRSNWERSQVRSSMIGGYSIFIQVSAGIFL